MGTSFRRNDFWDRLAGHLWLVLLMAALKIIYQAKLTLAPPPPPPKKDLTFTAPKAGLYLGTRLLLVPAITKLGRKLDQNSSLKIVQGCNRKQNRSSLKRKFKMADWAMAFFTYTIPEYQMVWNGADLFHLLNVWSKNTQHSLDDATCWVYSLYNINQLANGVIVPVMV